jgi:hypothetical protein
LKSKKKNQNAVALGRLGGKARAANLTVKELSEAARKAGQARKTKLSDAQRRRVAKAAAAARWSQKGKK